MSIELERGDIVLVNLEHVIGSVQGKTRPALIIQNNVGNKYSPVISVSSITSRVFEKEFLTNVFIPAIDSRLDKDSTVLLNQIMTIDKRRVIRKIGKINVEYLKKVDRAIVKSLDIDCLNVM